MEDNEMNIKQFAERLSKFGKKIDRGNISRYINTDLKPSSDFYIAMSVILDVNINWLLTGEGKPYMSDYVEKRDAFLSKKKTSKHSKQE